MSTACQTAFGTAELLEIILYGLPTKDLLLAQRVCQFWRNAILGSKKIQEALFLRPIGILDAAFGSPEDDNEQLQLPPARACIYGESSGATWYDRNSGTPVNRLLGNTLAFDNDYGYFDLARLHSFDTALTYREMFITQPAVTSCAYMMAGKFNGFFCAIEDTLQATQGVTVGILMDHVTTYWPVLAKQQSDQMRAAVEIWGVLEIMYDREERYLESVVAGRQVSEEQQAKTPHVFLRGCHSGKEAWSWLTNSQQLEVIKQGLKKGEMAARPASGVDAAVLDNDDEE